jgi:HK97 family phage portal protein
MAWNKSLSSESTKAMPYGAPVTTQGLYQQGQGYHDAWDIERAYREGIKKVTWVARAIDAIAGNQARLPMHARKNNSPYGRIVSKHDLLELLNTKSNPGENSFIFRYRLSSQLLLSTRGAFVEIVRGRSGKPIAIHLLPPQHTSPIPDGKKFVAGFEVRGKDGVRHVLPPEDVMWFRHPHPLDPYLSMTPMEAAGLAIESENLAKFYNRNFLINDGRPGSLVIVRGEMDEEDKEELRSRFRGNVSRAGATTVLASEGGVDFIDTAASPREASYAELRQITKEEILAAFGVPESVIGNASGRTYNNAAEEVKVFWMETMAPHLEMLARGFDDLDPEFYFDFDTSGVPALILAKQEREQFLLSEYQQGLITANEYRDGTGRKPVDSDLADSMLANPNLAPIGNTKRAMPYVDPAQQQAEQQAAMVPGAEEGAPPAPGAENAEQPASSGFPQGPEAASAPPPMAGSENPPPSPDAIAAAQEAGMMQTASLFNQTVSVKSFGEEDEWESKALQASERWEEIFDRTLERVFERQQRVVMEKARGAKAKKALTEGTLSVEAIWDEESWNRQVVEDVRPVIAGAVRDAAEMTAEQMQSKVDSKVGEYEQIIDAQTARVKNINQTTRDELAAAIATTQSMSEKDDRHGLLMSAIAAIFVAALMKRKRRIAEIEAQSAFNGGTYLAARDTGALKKVWLTRRDDRVRPEHRALHGTSTDLNKPFTTGGVDLRYPGDPLAPANLSIGCRCRLRFEKR